MSLESRAEQQRRSYSYIKPFYPQVELEVERIKSLMSNHNYGILDYQKNTLLHRIFKVFNEDSVKMSQLSKILLQNGVDPNAVNRENQSALELAVRLNQTKAVEFVLRQNRLHQRFSMQCTDTSLHHIAAKKQFRQMALILQESDSSLFIGNIRARFQCQSDLCQWKLFNGGEKRELQMKLTQRILHISESLEDCDVEEHSRLDKLYQMDVVNHAQMNKVKQWQRVFTSMVFLNQLEQMPVNDDFRTLIAIIRVCAMNLHLNMTLQHFLIFVQQFNLSELEILRFIYDSKPASKTQIKNVLAFYAQKLIKMSLIDSRNAVTCKQAMLQEVPEYAAKWPENRQAISQLRQKFHEKIQYDITYYGYSQGCSIISEYECLQSLK